MEGKQSCSADSFCLNNVGKVEMIPYKYMLEYLRATIHRDDIYQPVPVQHGDAAMMVTIMGSSEQRILGTYKHAVSLHVHYIGKKKLSTAKCIQRFHLWKQKAPHRLIKWCQRLTVVGRGVLLCACHICLKEQGPSTTPSRKAEDNRE